MTREINRRLIYRYHLINKQSLTRLRPDSECKSFMNGTSRVTDAAIKLRDVCACPSVSHSSRPIFVPLLRRLLRHPSPGNIQKQI